MLGLGGPLPHWETVPVDLDYHVRRIALPAPGSDAQLMELVSFLYPAPLDRTRPLWEVYVVDGLERGRMALFFKGHHAAADGASALRILIAALSETPNDDPRAPWAVPSSSRAPSVDRRGGMAMVGGAVKRTAAVATVAPKLAKLLPAAVRLSRNGVAPPFSAAKTGTMGLKISSARSFAMLDLPLDEVKHIAEHFGGKVNDVLMSVCDDAMHRYILETDGSRAGRMVAIMAFSTRPPGDASAGNDSAGMLVALGAPESMPAERLAQIVARTKRLKSAVRRTSHLPIELETMLMLTSLELREDMPIGRGWVPNIANFVLSNLPAGPQQALFLGRAKLAGLYIAPIVAPLTAVNFTVMSYHGSLCVGIAAARNIIPDTSRLAQLAADSFEELKATVPTETRV